MFNKDNFQKTLVSLRKKNGLTQASLADVLGVSDKVYSRWETGDTEPNLSSVAQLAEYYGVSPNVFFGREEREILEENISGVLDELPPSDAVQKAFELQFYAIRGLAKTAFERKFWLYEHEISPPENRVNHSRGMTSYASNDVYQMMYNGTDANIVLSVMPPEDKYNWFISEREHLAEYLSLIGDPDMMRCLSYILSDSFSLRYTAEYLAKATGLATEKVTELLDRAVMLQICNKTATHIGDKTVELYNTEADHMIIGILTLAHLSLPKAEKNGHYCCFTPCRITFSEKEDRYESR